MTVYLALLRAVNVGGTGKLLMSDLKSLCCDAGFTGVETYIASGNVVFQSEASASQVKASLETRLLNHTGKPVDVIIRTASEIQDILKANPFPDMPPKYTAVVFLDEPPPSNALEQVVGLDGEILWLGKRELFIHYPHGMGRSKLKIPAAKPGTARNMNTVAKLAEMALKLQGS